MIPPSFKPYTVTAYPQKALTSSTEPKFGMHQQPFQGKAVQADSLQKIDLKAAIENMFSKIRVLNNSPHPDDVAAVRAGRPTPYELEREQSSGMNQQPFQESDSQAGIANYVGTETGQQDVARLGTNFVHLHRDYPPVASRQWEARDIRAYRDRWPGPSTATLSLQHGKRQPQQESVSSDSNSFIATMQTLSADKSSQPTWKGAQNLALAGLRWTDQQGDSHSPGSPILYNKFKRQYAYEHAVPREGGSYTYSYAPASSSPATSTTGSGSGSESEGEQQAILRSLQGKRMGKSEQKQKKGESKKHTAPLAPHPMPQEPSSSVHSFNKESRPKRTRNRTFGTRLFQPSSAAAPTCSEQAFKITTAKGSTTWESIPTTEKATRQKISPEVWAYFIKAYSKDVASYNRIAESYSGQASKPAKGLDKKKYLFTDPQTGQITEVRGSTIAVKIQRSPGTEQRASGNGTPITR